MKHKKNIDCFCYSPFIEIDCMSNGGYAPCCLFSKQLTHEGRTLHALTDSFEDAWRSDSLHKLREQFIRNEQPVECMDCWNLESVGVVSYRQEMAKSSVYRHLNKAQIIQDYRRQTPPQKLHFRMSTKCNLKCRICSARSSSQILAETSGEKNSTPAHYYTKENEAVLHHWLPHLKEIQLLGGEHLVLDQNIEFLKMACNSGDSKHIVLYISTNGTLYSEALCNLLVKFQKAYIMFSIDDIHERFEYQRKGANYKAVAANILKYKNFFQKDTSVVLGICNTISLFNIFYLPEIFKAFYELSPKFVLYFNILRGPEELSVWNISDSVKAVIKKKLYASHALFRWQRHSSSKGIFGICDSISTFLMFKAVYIAGMYRVVTYMYGKKQNEHGNEFLLATKKLDDLRNEEYARVFPEFFEILRKEQCPQQIQFNTTIKK